MELNTAQIVDFTFKNDVLKGLSQFPKTLPSKYFYDKAGDILFQRIMALPEYYLTQAEFEILTLHKKAISEYFRGHGKGFDLIELGAGDGTKTKVLLNYMTENGFSFTYKPIDISKHAIENLLHNLEKELPQIEVKPEIGEYFQVLNKLKKHTARKKVIMFLGSNIGNLSENETIDFLKKLGDCLGNEDLIFMGFDQKKNPQTILDAYNDGSGVTSAFNKNILVRINRELKADFNVEKFAHWEVYNPETGTAKSYLVATEPQEVNIEELQFKIKFEAWETIHTEISQKYDDKLVERFAKESGLHIEKWFTDPKGFYKNYIFKK